MTESKKEKIFNDWKNGNGDDKQAYKNMTKLEMLEFIEYCGRFESRHLIINRMRIILFDQKIKEWQEIAIIQDRGKT